MQTVRMVRQDIGNHVDILGLPLCAEKQSWVEQTLVAWIQERQGRTVVTLNPEIALRSQSDPSLRISVEQASLIVPDGAGVVWAARRLHGLRLKRIPGIELASFLIRTAAQDHIPVYFLGGREGVAAKAAASWKTQCPNLVIAETQHGFFHPSQEEGILRKIEEIQPGLLLIGMGVGKQERLMKHLPSSSFGVALGIGGAMEIWSGEKQRAPAWVRGLSLEWAYRVLVDPRRLGRLLRTIPFFVRVWWKSLQKNVS